MIVGWGAIHVHAYNVAAAAREIAHHLAHAILRNAHFDLVDRFKQARLRLRKGFLERPVCGDLKGNECRLSPPDAFCRREIHLYIDDAVTGEDAFGASVACAALDRRDENTMDRLA